MRTRVLLATVAALVLVIGLTAIASNMGFKISIPLTQGATNFVSLPYYSNFANANELYSDVPGCTEVSRWDNGTGAWAPYTGGRTSWALTPGESVVVLVDTTIDWICVGSHDPTHAVPLTAGYTNFVAVPYHSTAANANQLYTEITDCTEVSRWDNGTGAWSPYTGGRTSWDLTPGEGVVVLVGTTSNWTPAHY